MDVRSVEKKNKPQKAEVKGTYRQKLHGATKKNDDGG